MSLKLLHSPADIVRRLLIAQSEGTGPENDPLQDWPVYIDNEPTTPDEVVTVYDTDPRRDGRSMPTGESMEHLGFQVRVRSTTHPLAFAKAESIKVTLSESVNHETITIGSNSYLVHCVSNVFILRLGKNAPDSKRSLYVLNGFVSITRLT